MSPAGKSPLFLALEHNRYHLALLLLRYGATIPPHSTEKERFLRFVGDDANPDKVYDLDVFFFVLFVASIERSCGNMATARI